MYNVLFVFLVASGGWYNADSRGVLAAASVAQPSLFSFFRGRSCPLPCRGGVFSCIIWTLDRLWLYGQVKPDWEDLANIAGGRWVARREHKQSDDVWLNLLLFLIGEHADLKGGLVTGAVVSVRKAGDRLALWISKADNLETVVKVNEPSFRHIFPVLLDWVTVWNPVCGGRLGGRWRKDWVCDARRDCASASTGTQRKDLFPLFCTIWMLMYGCMYREEKKKFEEGGERTDAILLWISL